MKILEIRLLPPIVIGRLGASEQALEAFSLATSDQDPLGFRQIVPQTSLIIDPVSGQITRAYVPDSITFKDGVNTPDEKNGQIRPVAPFIELYAITDEAPDVLVPLTNDMISSAGVSMLLWEVSLANIKIFRRTNDPEDKIIARLASSNLNTARHPLPGSCGNFLAGKTLPLGYFQCVQPDSSFPGIRFRFTPGPGKVYGASLRRNISDTVDEADPIINDESLVLYDTSKGSWKGYKESSDYNPLYTNPAQIFAGYANADGDQVSWGYLDDECDGYLQVTLNFNDGTTLSTSAHLSAGPPAFAPDTLPVRVVSDELEQIILGPDADEDVSIEEAQEIVRRAFETVRLMNSAVMNGNLSYGRPNIASTMARQDTNDFGRYFSPLAATSLVDNLALRALHERVFNGLATGSAPWFASVLRQPEEIGDLSDEGRRKMPALMRGADGRALTLTRLQISKIVKAATSALFKAPPVNGGDIGNRNHIGASDLMAQLFYEATGNPYSVLPRSAISNCFPGLEFDFRNLWRRAFQGIVLSENNNYVVEATGPLANLLHHRLVAVDGRPTMVPTKGPTFPQGDSAALITENNPNGVSFMEWSNSLVFVLAGKKPGDIISCHFTNEVSEHEVVVKADELDKYLRVDLPLNAIFVPGTATISSGAVLPGELTQGLCAPWQNDYRECACYYWAASRPDFVNVVADEKGLSAGDNWMAKKRTGQYIPDNRKDSRLLSYDDLFQNWQGELNFIIKGKDAISSADTGDKK